MDNILVCDDDKAIVEAIEIYLTQEGYHILKAYDGQEALDILTREPVDLLIMDIMMPHLDGIRATVKIRENNPLPIIILSAKSEDTDKILGLNIGADDYITKPFNPLELIARVKSQLRRYTQLGSVAPAASEHIYTTGGLTVNDDKKEVLVDGEPVRMTPIEYNILLLLMKIRDTFSPPHRSMKVSGMKMPWQQTTPWLYISATSVKRSKSIPENHAI